MHGLLGCAMPAPAAPNGAVSRCCAAMTTPVARIARVQVAAMAGSKRARHQACSHLSKLVGCDAAHAAAQLCCQADAICRHRQAGRGNERVGNHWRRRRRQAAAAGTANPTPLHRPATLPCSTPGTSSAAAALKARQACASAPGCRPLVLHSKSASPAARRAARRSACMLLALQAAGSCCRVVEGGRVKGAGLGVN